MLLLQISILPNLLYNIAGFLALVIGLIGAFFNLKNEISLLKSEKNNMKTDIVKLENRVNNSESKIQAQLTALDKKLDNRLEQVYDKIDKLPQDLSVLFKNIIGKNNS